MKPTMAKVKIPNARATISRILSPESDVVTEFKAEFDVEFEVVESGIGILLK